AQRRPARGADPGRAARALPGHGTSLLLGAAGALRRERGSVPLVLTLAPWIRDRARLTPDRTAIVFGDRLVTYRELDEGSDARAAAFAARGLVRGDCLATLTGNSPEHVEVFFACAKAGLILLPLNWRLARPELEFQLADAEPRLLLVEDGLEPVGSLPVESFGAPPAASFEPVAQDDDPLLLIYTSGPTGRPKGALL